MKGAYTPEPTPVARPRDIVELDNGSSKMAYEVQQYAVLPEVVTQEFTVADGTRESNVVLENLALWDSWLGQYRFKRLADDLPDGVSIEFDQGGSQAPLYQNLNQRGSLNNDSLSADFPDNTGTSIEVEPLSHLAEFYVLGDESPEISIENDSGAQVTFDLTYFGWKFGLKQVRSGEVGNRTPVYVPVQSIRGD